MATSGPNYPGTVNNREDGTGGSPAGGAWASSGNVTADDGSVATWTKPATSGVIGDTLEVYAFGTFTGVASDDTIDAVQIEVETTQANTTRLDPFQVELYDGATTQIGTTRTTTDSTGAQIDTFDFTGVTYSQLATLRVRVRPRGATANAQSSTATVDFIRLNVTYTPTFTEVTGTASTTLGVTATVDGVSSQFIYDVLVLVSDSNAAAQTKINAASSSAIVGFEAGVHAERKVTPKIGQTLRGDPSGGTVFDGSRPVTGWTGSNPWVATHTIADRGVFTEGLRSFDIGAQYPEELFYETPGVNTGWTRKFRTGTPGTTTPAAGKWTMSYSAGTLRVADDPTATNVRISVTDRAIVSPGTGAGGLTIEDITFRKYATETRACPWGHGSVADHRDWTIRRVASYDSHGAAGVACPGDTLRNCLLGYAGQIGFLSSTSVGAYSNGWELLDTEISYNLRAQYDYGWEGGGTKFQTTPDNTVPKPVVIRNCWFHHNGGVGIWADVNETVTGHSLIESNLAEYNEVKGVFWEISAGTVTIRWNRCLNNGEGTTPPILGGTAPSAESATGIDISNSRGALVTQNVVEGNPTGVMVRDDNRSPFLDGCSVQDNSVKPGPTGGNIVKIRPDVDATRIATCGADRNRYWPNGRGYSYNNVFGMSFAAWQAARGGTGLTGALDPNGTGGLTGSVTDPPTFTAYRLAQYGPLDLEAAEVTGAAAATLSVTGGGSGRRTSGWSEVASATTLTSAPLVEGTATTTLGLAATAAGVPTVLFEGLVFGGITATVLGTRVRPGVAAATLGLTATADGAPIAAIAGTAATTLTVTATAVGAPLLSGAAQTALALSATIAGSVQGIETGTAAATLGLSATIAGTPTRPGTAQATLSLTATAAGVPASLGQADVTLALTATAAGIPTKPATAATTLTLSATIAGRRDTTATAATTLGIAATAAGVVQGIGEGFAQATLPLTATAAGTVQAFAQVAASLAITATVAGVPTKPATAAATLAVSATAAGTPDKQATAAATLALTATIAGIPTSLGLATATLGLSATVVGEVEGIATGTAAATLGLTATIAGRPTRPGSAATTLPITATISGQGVGPIAGTAATTVGLTATTVGVRVGLGTATRTLTITGTATGLRSTSGTAGQTITLAAVVLGVVSGPTMRGGGRVVTAPAGSAVLVGVARSMVTIGATNGGARPGPARSGVTVGGAPSNVRPI